jgi:hypothetical protein
MYLIWHTKVMGRTGVRSAGKNWDEVGKIGWEVKMH